MQTGVTPWSSHHHTHVAIQLPEGGDEDLEPNDFPEQASRIERLGESVAVFANVEGTSTTSTFKVRGVLSFRLAMRLAIWM